MKLVVATPERIVVETEQATALRAEDESGGFGVLPGHADLLTVLVPAVLAWRDRAGAEHYVAVRGGVLSVRGGAVAVATPEAFAGDDIEAIAAALAAAAAVHREREAVARTETAALEAAAIRRIEDYLRANGEA